MVTVSSICRLSIKISNASCELPCMPSPLII
uniref:Uncharacterized protein n=1 Tax=Rhizophora mucronata TaxID=61149 RepID=A0A2P2MZ37_RHIMU